MVRTSRHDGFGSLLAGPGPSGLGFGDCRSGKEDLGTLEAGSYLERDSKESI